MADDNVASLGFSVDSSQIDKGAASLDNLTNSATSAGDSADRAKSKFVGLGSAASEMGGSFSQASQKIGGIKTDTDKVSDAFTSMRASVVAANKPLVDNGMAATSMGAAINTALSKSSVSFDDLKKSITAANGGLKEGAAAAEETAKAHEHFSTQAQSALHAIRGFGEQVALGVSPLQAATAQMNHLSYAATGEGGLAGAFGQIKDKVGGGIAAIAEVATPLRLLAGGAIVAGAAVAAMAYEWSKAQHEIDQALIGIGRRTGTSRDDINKFASDNATAMGLSVSQARDAAVEFTKTGQITVSQLKGVGDAISGFSILTGTTAPEAAKVFAAALSGDLVKGAQELDKVYGALDGRTLQYVATLQATGDKQQAQQIIINALAEQNKKAEDSVGNLTKAYNLLGNAASAASNVIGKAYPAAATALIPGAPLAANFIPGGRSQLDVDSEKNKSQMAQDTQGGDNAVRTLLPQIDAYQKLLNLQNDLNKARDSAGAQGLGGFNAAAATAAENAATATKDALQTSISYNERVKEISQSWGGVSQSTALSLQASSNQLPVIQAITGASQQAAQYAADYANALDRGKDPADAAALAADNLAKSQAAATTSVEKQVQSLKDSTALIEARKNGTEAEVAAAIAYRQAVESGASPMAAATLSSETLANRMAQAAASTRQMADNLQAAAANEQKAIDAAAVSAHNAGLVVGGDSGSYQSDSGSFGSSGGGGGFNSNSGLVKDFGGAYYTISDYTRLLAQRAAPPDPSIAISAKLGAGNVDSAYQAAAGAGKAYTSGYFDFQTGDDFRTAHAANPSEPLGLLDQVTQLLNSQTSDKGQQIGNLQKEISYVSQLPETLARDQKLADLSKSIQDLKKATDANTAATEASLNPLYSGRGALHVGYYKAAKGLDVIAQGPTVGDQVPFHAMVNGGERITITPANQRPTSAGSSTTINNFDLRGMNSNASRLSARQVAQGFGRTVAVASR